MDKKNINPSGILVNLLLFYSTAKKMKYKELKYVAIIILIICMVFNGGLNNELSFTPRAQFQIAEEDRKKKRKNKAMKKCSPAVKRRKIKKLTEAVSKTIEDFSKEHQESVSCEGIFHFKDSQILEKFSIEIKNGMVFSNTYIIICRSAK